MQVLKTIDHFRDVRKKLTGKIAFVPTMGALHEGHLTLMRDARKYSDAVVVSIFVNPTQFGPNEDFDKYPRTEEKDLAACDASGVDYVFMPDREDLYGGTSFISMQVGAIADVLCGAKRPGHFNGVVQVVSILFNIVQPDVAVFGKKDFQQLAIIRRMVEEYHFPVEIIGIDTVREYDGLAMSSRNRYLSDEERAKAPEIFKTMKWIKEQYFSGSSKNVENLESTAKKRLLEMIPNLCIDYLEIRNCDTLEKVEVLNDKSHLFIAAFFGKTRLIDNMALGVI